MIKRKRAIFIVKLIACPLCFAVFFYMVPAEAWTGLSSLNWSVLPVLLLVTIALTALNSLRLYFLLRPLATGVSFRSVFFSAFVSAFAGFFMPVSAAGDVARFFWLDRQLVEGKKSQLLSAMLLDRLLSLFINILLLVVVVFLVIDRAIPFDAAVAKKSVPIVAALCLALVLGALFIMPRLRTHAFVAETLQAVTAFSGRPIRVCVCAFISVASYAFSCVGLLAAAMWAVGATMSWDAVFFTGLASSLLSLVPIAPGGLGFMEMSQTGLLVWFSCPAGKAAQAVILLRGTAILTALPGGIALFLSPKRGGSRSVSGEGGLDD